MRKKLLLLSMLISLFTFGIIAQATDFEDDDYIPFDEDLSIIGGEETASSEVVPKSSIAQGLWIEAMSINKSIIRDIATGEIPGYEFDNSQFKSYANWWFWGDINSNFHLDAEISVWDFSKTMYQANSFAANVPDVTLGDGFQSLASMFFSPLYYGNDDGIGVFNKMGFNIVTPYVLTRIGYGQLKENGMSAFTGIYNVLDRWDDVGNGYLEISNGNDIKEIGKIKLNILSALSLMRGTYGTYNFIDVSMEEYFRGVVTFGSTTTSSELFRYNEQNENAVSLYLSSSFLDMFNVQLHGLTSYGTDENPFIESSAIAGLIGFEKDSIKTTLSQKFAGEFAKTVWGDDETLGVDTATTQLDFWWDVNSLISFGFDEGFVMNDIDSLSTGLYTIRNQPMIDFNFLDLIEKDIFVSLYGVFNIDRIDLTTAPENIFAPYFEEAGIELALTDVFTFIPKLTFDYAAYLTYDDWNSTDGKKNNMFYNSFMLNIDLSNSMSINSAAIIRSSTEELTTLVPFGFAIGFSTKLSFIGSPRFWAHFTYSMNPYEYFNYSLYRKDDASVGYAHRTYLLNCTDSVYANTESNISLGLIWDLK